LVLIRKQPIAGLPKKAVLPWKGFDHQQAGDIEPPLSWAEML
jgi:hypothetical protein